MADQRIPSGLSPMRLRLLQTCEPEIGKLEATGRNDGPVEVYMPPWARGQGLPYCAWGAGWAWNESFGFYPYGVHLGSVWDVYQAAKKHGEFIAPEAEWPALLPQPGDFGIILYDKDGNPDTRDPGHKVIVFRVDYVRRLLNCCEWNWKNRVGFTTRRFNEFLGFCNPFGRHFGPDEHSMVGWELGVISAPMASGGAVSTR